MLPTVPAAFRLLLTRPEFHLGAPPLPPHVMGDRSPPAVLPGGWVPGCKVHYRSMGTFHLRWDREILPLLPDLPLFYHSLEFLMWSSTYQSITYRPRSAWNSFSAWVFHCRFCLPTTHLGYRVWVAACRHCGGTCHHLGCDWKDLQGHCLPAHLDAGGVLPACLLG